MYHDECMLDMDEVEEVNSNFVPLVEDCIKNSFVEQGNLESGNKLLKEDREWATAHHIDYHPTVTINNFTYRGDLSAADLTEAICSAY